MSFLFASPCRRTLLTLLQVGVFAVVGGGSPALAQETPPEASVPDAGETAADRADARSPASDSPAPPPPAPVARQAPDAGTPARASAVNLEAVVVSATRTSLVASEAPAAVSVVSSAKFEERNVSRLGDALTRVPSLYLQGGALGQSQGGSGSSGMSLRGIDQRKTLILIDGQPVQDANSGSVNWRTIQTNDIDRVEVVPGPFSSLYGSNAIGGVINVITKQPDRSERTFKVRKGFGDASGIDLEAYLREHFDNGLGVAAGVTYGSRESYVNEFVLRAPAATGTPDTPVTGAIPTTTPTGTPTFLVGDKGTSPWTQLNATAKVTYEVAPGHKLNGGVAYNSSDASYTYFHSYLKDAAGAPVSSGKTLGVDGQLITLGESNFVNSSPIRESSTRLFAGYEGLFLDSLVVKVDVAHIARQYSFSTVGSASTYASGPGDLTASPNGAFDANATLSFPVGTLNYVVAGLSTHLESVNRRVSSLSAWRDPSTITGVKNGYDGLSQTFSLFAQDELSLPVLSLLKIYLGVRVDRWETQGRYFQNTAPVSTEDYVRRGEWAFSPKLSAVFKPIESLTVRGSVGRSFRAPTNLDLYSTAVISSGSSSTGYLTTQADPRLSPERATSWEIGAEWHAPVAGIIVGATYYENYLTNLIYSKTVDTSLTQRINAGAATVRGVELAASAQVFQWLGLSASYTWVGSKITSNDSDPDSVGKRLSSSPEHLVNAAIDLRYDRWLGTISLRRVSHIYQNSQNTDRVEHVPGAYDSYYMVDAKVGVELLKGIRLSVAVNNLLDQKVYAFYLMPRRNFTADLTVSF